jgi:hypothetical protein
VRALATVGRFLGAVSAAAVLGSLALAAYSAVETGLAEASIFSPAESFRLVFAYALILSWPAVALTMALFVPATNSFVPARGVRRRNLALLIGAVGGMVVAIPVAALLMDGRIEAAVPIGLVYGLSSAAAGLLLLSGPDAGREIG